MLLPPGSSASGFVFPCRRVCPALYEDAVRVLANCEWLWEGRIGTQPRGLMLRVRRRLGETGRRQLGIGVEADLSGELTSQIAMLDGHMPTISMERLIVVVRRTTAGAW